LRWSEGVCVLEGPDLVRAALWAGVEFEGLYIDGVRAGDPEIEGLRADATAAGVRCFELAAGVIERVADAASPQPVLAAVRFVVPSLDDVGPRGMVVDLHDVRDPGNLGTIVRTADAAGASAVVLSGHCADPFGPKTLRATAGSIFRVPVLVAPDLRVAVDWFSRSGGPTLATTARGGDAPDVTGLDGDVMVVFGNESGGLGDDELAHCAGRLSIPMVGDTESVNVAIAAGVVLFESLRQRRLRAAKIAPPTMSGQ
jgi:TrmH family RNA methyltransferase